MTDGNIGVKILGLITEEKLNAKGQGHRSAKNRPPIKQDAGCDHKPHQPPPCHLEWFAHRLPHDIHAKRHGQVQRKKKGKVDMGKKRTGNGEKIELFPKKILHTGQQAAGRKEERQGRDRDGCHQRLDKTSQFKQKKGEGFQGLRHGFEEVESICTPRLKAAKK